MDFGLIWIPAATLGLVGLLSSLRILWEYERGVVFRLGKLTRAKGPGLIFLVPYGIERMRRMDLRIIALDIAPQDTITKDNVSCTVNAVVYFRVVDPSKAVVEVEDYYFATSQIAQTTLRSVVGQSELDELLAERERINEIVRRIIDMETDPWGIEVTAVEIKDIDLPKVMKRAMAKQAEAERERRGKVIAAEGEFQASKKLSQAAQIISQHPVALQLRFLQTVVEVAAENNSTTLFPIPVDLFAPFVEKATGVEGGGFAKSLTGEDARALAAAAVEALESGSGAERAVDSGEAQRLLEGAKRALGMAESAAVEQSDDSEGAVAATEPADD
ncbi:MAG: slipin family protein [Gemmatimonadetes bacterium]|nr:slipin family protein [Gemmatimonadota bacterium]MYE70110.1 slipin family protein [Gemmatimonadota bacterium]MYJ67486.1 slipin family protein [Gemmatimonadota bacterium]